jgi:hypothetical protein
MESSGWGTVDWQQQSKLFDLSLQQQWCCDDEEVS